MTNAEPEPETMPYELLLSTVKKAYATHKNWPHFMTAEETHEITEMDLPAVLEIISEKIGKEVALVGSPPEEGWTFNVKQLAEYVHKNQASFAFLQKKTGNPKP